MPKKIILLCAFLFLTSCAPFTWAETADSPGRAEIFAELGGVGAGIVFDQNGSMLVGKSDELVKITPDGKVIPFCSLKQLSGAKKYYFPSPLIWDMTIDKNHNILAAAQDRILLVTPDGIVTSLIKEDFGGFIGASGIELDREGNFYITDGGKILKFTPDLKKTVFIDATKQKLKISWLNRKIDIELHSFISLEFDPNYKNLYVSDFNSATLLRYPILPDGTAGKPDVLFNAYSDDLDQAPLNLIFGEKGNIYISNDISSRLLKITKAGKKERIPIGGQIKNHMIAFGGKGFDEECIYFTTYDGKVYKYFIGEKTAAKRP